MYSNPPKLGTPSRQAAVSMAAIYGLVTIEMLMRRMGLSREFAGVEQGVMGRLVRDGWLATQYVTEQIRIFHLTPQAAYRLKLPANRGRRLGLQAVMGKLAIALDCNRRGKEPFDSMTIESGYLARVARASAIFTHGEKINVVWLLVDHGKEPKRLAYKIGELAREMVIACPQPVFSGDFGIRVIVPSAGKVPLVAHRLRFDPPAGDCAVEFGEVPELSQLLLARRS